MIKNIPINEQINIWRDDIIEPEQMLTQEKALENAKETFEGYVKVPLVVER